MKWLRKLLGLCQHKWELRGRVVLTVNKAKCGHRYIFQCAHCGKIKKQDVI
jgi:hypothetical protein